MAAVKEVYDVNNQRRGADWMRRHWKKSRTHEADEGQMCRKNSTGSRENEEERPHPHK